MASLRAYLGAYMVRSRVRGPLSRARDAAAFRRIFEAPTFPDPKGVTYEPGIVGGVKGEWVRLKAGPGRRMLYIHGGGFIACSPRTHRPITGALANRGFTIFAPDYRLAPEHPFPAAVDDVTAAWAAFSAEGAACVAGESAGGNLALVLMGQARARGLPPWRITLNHAARNALLPLVTMLGLQAASMLGGSVVIESVFGIPGFGRLAQEAVAGRDAPLLMAVILVSALMVVAANLLVDLAYGLVNPRIRHAR